MLIKNEYEVKGNYVVVKLKKRGGEIYETLIDLGDLTKIKTFNVTWYAAWAKNTRTFYAKCSEYKGIVNGKPKYKTHYLHRFIMGENEKYYIDHINHNTLDNRKENLRITLNKQNTKNRKSRNSNNTSGYRNVS